MKKLGKLSINPEKVIKNEELVNLRGGEYGVCPGYSNWCICEGSGGQLIICGVPVYSCGDVYETETGSPPDACGGTM
jgi:natural product precursor